MYTPAKHHLSNLCKCYCLLNLDPMVLFYPFSLAVKNVSSAPDPVIVLNNETDYTIILLGMLL